MGKRCRDWEDQDWAGGYYELALAQVPSVGWSAQDALASAAGMQVCDEDDGYGIHGSVEVFGGVTVPCRVVLVVLEEEWVNLLLPLAGLARVPGVDESALDGRVALSGWRVRLDAFLVHAARRYHERHPINYGEVGFEVEMRGPGERGRGHPEYRDAMITVDPFTYHPPTAGVGLE